MMRDCRRYIRFHGGISQDLRGSGGAGYGAARETHLLGKGGKPFPARYSRHYYDVAMLSETAIKDEALADLQLLGDVVRHKQTFYPAAWARYDLAVPGTLKLVPEAAGVSAFRQDYRDMTMMIFGDAPRFESIMEKLAVLEGELNTVRAA